MTPVPEWRRVLRHAWSVRLNAGVALCSAAGEALMLVNPQVAGHPYMIALVVFGLTGIGSVGSILLRVMSQDKPQ